MDMLFLRLPAHAGDPLQAVSCRDGHWLREGSWHRPDELGGWLQAQAGTPLLLLVPPAREVSAVIEAGLKQRREAGDSLVALAEDQVAEDYEKLHWSLSPLDDQRVLARGVQRAWLQGWVELLQRQGARIAAALPESMLYHDDSGSWLWLPQGEEIWLQAGAGQSAVVAAADAIGLLSDLAGRRPVGGAPLRLRYPPGSQLPPLPATLQPAMTPWQDWATLLKQLPATRWQKHPLNWLRGTQRPDGEPARRSPWAIAAVLLIAVGLLQTGMNRLQAKRWQADAEQARMLAEQRYRQWFPDERRISNLERQFDARVRASHQVTLPQMLQLLADTSPASVTWQVDKMEYKQDAPLQLDVSGGSPAALQDWAAALNLRGIAAEVLSTRVEAGVPRARLSLGRPQGERS